MELKAWRMESGGCILGQDGQVRAAEAAHQRPQADPLLGRQGRTRAFPASDSPAKRESRHDGQTPPSALQTIQPQGFTWYTIAFILSHRDNRRRCEKEDAICHRFRLTLLALGPLELRGGPSVRWRARW